MLKWPNLSSKKLTQVLYTSSWDVVVPGKSSEFVCVIEHFLQKKKSHLDEDIEEDQRQDDEASEGRGQQQDHQHLEQLEQVAQHHLEAVRDHAVDGVHVAGEAVEQVPTGRDLEEGDGRAQDAEQQGGVKLARGHHTAQGDGQRRPQLA